MKQPSTPEVVESDAGGGPPPAPRPAEPVIVAELANLPPSGLLPVEVDGRRILIVHDGTDVYAVDPSCTHAGGPLEQGTLHGCLLACPWHGAVFDVRDGQPNRGPARKGLRTYRVSCRDGQLALEIPDAVDPAGGARP